MGNYAQLRYEWRVWQFSRSKHFIKSGKESPHCYIPAYPLLRACLQTVERRLASPNVKGHSKATTVKVMQTLKPWIMTTAHSILFKFYILTRKNLIGYYYQIHILPKNIKPLTNLQLWLENSPYHGKGYFYDLWQNPCPLFMCLEIPIRLYMMLLKYWYRETLWRWRRLTQWGCKIAWSCNLGKWCREPWDPT